MRAITPNKKEWNVLSTSAKEALARDLASTLSDVAITFEKIQTHRYAGYEEELAFFTLGDSRFVFLPGTTSQIGFEIDDFRPTEGQVESFVEACEDLIAGVTLDAYLKMYLGRQRAVTISSLLVECELSDDLGKISVDTRTPAIQELINGYGGKTGIVVRNEDFKVCFNRDGTYEAWRFEEVLHDDVAKELTRSGFRLPTSDEWEYFCAGGAKTLFRWGDDNPVGLYPCDDWAYQKNRPGPKEPLTENFTLHCDANRFGMTLPSTCYKVEIVAQPGVLRGGDGGSTVCGGLGWFLGWLPLATSFIDPYIGNELQEKSISVTGNHMRRVLDLEKS